MTAVPETYTIAIAKIEPSSTNPRGAIRHDEHFRELVASITSHGVLQPVLVRPNGKKGSFELVAGHRRYAAAAAAGLQEIPATVRELDDKAVLEIQLIENLQRQDLHPLEEARGYRQLIQLHGYTAETIGQRIDRSTKYVYDRIKLLELTPAAKKLFADGKITAGHAILLARLSAKDQARALDPELTMYDDCGLFREDMGTGREQRIANRKERKDDPLAGLTLGSVREFSSWIQDNVRLDPKLPELGELFPETTAAIARAEGQKVKIVQITQEHSLPQDLGDGEKIYTVGSWRPADGKTRFSNDRYQSVIGKKCEHAVLGVFTLGEGQGRTMSVCVTKTCATHWPKPKPLSKQHAAAKAADDARRARWKKENAQRRVRQERWKKSVPALRQALAVAIKGASLKALGDQLIDLLQPRFRAPELITRGSSADDLVRHLAYLVLAESAGETWQADDFAKRAKRLGINVDKVLDQAAPVQTSAKKKGKP